MITRKIQHAVTRLASQFPVIGITGPRQSGKTTLAKHLFPHKEYITFDDESIRSLAKNNPRDFLSAFPDGMVIDEAQKLPEIFDAIKINVDTSPHTPGKFILTGSSQFRLKKNMSDSLAGRSSYIRLMPFSSKEILEEGIQFESVYDLVLKGFYPPLYDTNKFYDPGDWFDAYIDTYLDLDVSGEINYSNLSVFKAFIKTCALHSGNILSMDSISRELAVSSPTVKSWLSILESSYIIHLLPAAAGNKGKELIKSPKLYFIDTGLLCHLLDIKSKKDLILSAHKGHVMETFAISELLKHRYNNARKPELSYYRDKKGFEIDIIADWDNHHAIEVKSDSSPSPKHSAVLKKYMSLPGGESADCHLFYLGDKKLKIDNIEYTPWKEWLQIEP